MGLIVTPEGLGQSLKDSETQLTYTAVYRAYLQPDGGTPWRWIQQEGIFRDQNQGQGFF